MRGSFNKNIFALLTVGGIVFILIFWLPVVNAGGFTIRTGGVRLKTDLKSPGEILLKDIVPLKQDPLGGAASLATILSYFYGDPVGEEEIISELSNYVSSNIDDYSLLEIKRVADSRGYSASGLRGNLVGLQEIDLPCIVMFNYPGFSHFTVVREVVEKEVVLADPAFGNIGIEKEDFITMWSGVFLAIGGNGRELAKRPVQLYIPPEAPDTGLLSRILGVKNLDKLGFNRYEF